MMIQDTYEFSLRGSPLLRFCFSFFCSSMSRFHKLDIRRSISAYLGCELPEAGYECDRGNLGFFRIGKFFDFNVVFSFTKENLS